MEDLKEDRQKKEADLEEDLEEDLSVESLKNSRLEISWPACMHVSIFVAKQ